MSSFQRDLEIQLLSAARRTRDDMDKVVKELGEYACTEQTINWLWDRFKAFWKRKEMPRLETLQAQINTEALEAHEPLMETLIEVWKAAPSTTPMADCEVLRNLSRHDKLAKGMDRAVKSLARGDLDNARDMMAAAAAEAAAIEQGGLKVEALIDWADWTGEADSFKGIPTGIGTYDEVSYGGANRGDLGVILGNTGMGKSILATNIGFTGIKHRLRVLHCDSENGKDRVKSRYIARILRIATNPLMRRRLNDDVRGWMERQMVRLNELCKIISFGVDCTTLDQLDAKIFETIDGGWRPDVIIVDSPDHCVINTKNDNAGALAQMRYARMKSIAQRANAVNWTVTQAKPESEGKIVTNKHVAWGADKARLADHVLTINPGLGEDGQPLSEKEMGNSRSLFVAKARGSRGRFIIPLMTDLASAYISEAIEGITRPDEALDGGN